MQVKLTILGGPSDGLEVSLSRLPVTFGREGDSSVPMRDRWASRHHCELFETSGRLMIRDLASKHGTYINGDRVDEHELLPGDKLMVGLTVISIESIFIGDNETHESAEANSDRPSGVGA